MKSHFFVLFALVLVACNTDKIVNPLEYTPQKIPGVCEDGFSPIAVNRTDISARPGGLAALPKGTYTLLSSEFFVNVSGGDVPAITYATHILDGSNPSYPSCTRGVKNTTPLVDISYDAIQSYTYNSTPLQVYTPARYEIKFGPNVEALLTPSLPLAAINGPAAMPGGYTTINVYELGTDKFEIRAIKGAMIGGKAVGMNILQRFSYVAAP